MIKAFTRMLLPNFLLLGGLLQAQAQQPPGDLKEKLTARITATDAATVLQQLQQQTHYTFTFDDADLKKVKLTGLDLGKITLSEALHILNRKYGLLFAIENHNISVKAGAVKSKTAGHITGQVLDAVTNDPVIGVSVTSGLKAATTGANGQYDIELQEGIHTLLFSFIGYTPKKITEVTVTPSTPFILNITLTAQEGTLKGVEVVATARKESLAALYLRQKNNAALSDGISAEQIRVTPDNNAAQVLKRISGLTVQDEKFVTIRGLSDRYNNVMLNGATLPSTEPNRRNFAFDIIPSSIIDNIVVNKTATPDLPSEFAGGLVQVSTRDLPEKNYTVIGIGSGYNTNSAGKKMLGTPRGNKDYLGYDDGRRSWWQHNWNRFEYASYYWNKRYDLMGEMNRRIPNNWGLYQYRYNPLQQFQLGAGRRIRLKNEGVIGVTFGVQYRHEETIDDEQRRIYYGEMYNYTEGSGYTFRSSLGSLLNVVYQRKGNKIAFKNLYNHLFNNETLVYNGSIEGFGRRTINRNYTSNTLINSLWQHRLEGEHSIGSKGIKVDWSGDLIRTVRDQPDSRNSMGFTDPGLPKEYYEYYLAEKTGFLGVGSSIFSSLLKEKRYNWSANVTVPFSIAGHQQKLKAGYTGSRRDAYFESIGLLVTRDGLTASDPNFSEQVNTLPDYQLFSDQFLKPGYLYLYPAGPNASGGAPGEDYAGFQQLHAGYLMMDATFLKKFRLIGGVRLEQNRMDVTTITYQAATGYAVDSLIKYSNRYWLPSFNLVYSFNPKMNMRLAYSKTLSRPDFRERSPFIYYEFKERAEYKGAKGLKDAMVTNIDARYEYYISTNEIVSVSAFYKKFDSPVELVASGTPGGGQSYYYFNLRNSTAYGVEVDFRKSFSFIHPGPGFWSNLYLSGNATWMKANVKYNTQAMLNASNEIGGTNLDVLPPDSRNRPLQGLSPYVLNGGIGYAGKPVGVNISYNRYGSRIVAGGLYPYEDQYENSRDVLDLQFNTRLLHNKLDLRLNISDLLKQPFIIYHNFKDASLVGSGDLRDNVNDDPKGTGYNPDKDYVRFRSYRGSNVSLSISYSF